MALADTEPKEGARHVKMYIFSGGRLQMKKHIYVREAALGKS